MAGLPELLAPAGCWESLKAAVANGADAVYFGVEQFNARLRAENFRTADLPEVMDWLHRRGAPPPRADVVQWIKRRRRSHYKIDGRGIGP